MSVRNRPNRTFLHRNFISATNMGLKASSPTRPPGDRSFHEDDYRPAKRRRLADSPASLDGVTLYDGPEDHGRSLRIDILKITHKDLARVRFNTTFFNGPDPPSVKDVTETQVRCKITVSCRRGGMVEILHVDTQIFAVKASRNPIGTNPVARFCSQPFFIPEEKIMIQQDDEDMFSMANSLGVSFELSSASSGDSQWPLLGLGSRNEDLFYGQLPRRQWVLTATNPDIFHAWSRSNLPLSLKKQQHHDLTTDFVLQTDIRWKQPVASPTRDKDLKLSSIIVDGEKIPMTSTCNGTANGNSNGHEFKSLNGSMIGIIDKAESINCAIELDGVGVVDSMHGVNGHLVNGTEHLNGIGYQPNGAGHHLNSHLEPGEAEAEALAYIHMNGMMPDAEDLAEGELTPSRSRRAKQGINYNVRQMWNTAVGKEPKKRRKPSDQESGECGVTYHFPPEQLHLNDFTCVLCGARNNSHTQLQLHLRSHPQYEFYFDTRPRSGCHVSAVPNMDYGSPLRTKVFQLGLPVRPFDLESYVNGDESWVTSRFGPDNDRDVHRRIVQAKPRAPQTRQPTKIVGTDRIQERQKPVYRRAIKKPPTLVPNIKQPLYDPISKAQLLPGTEIRTHKVDTAWLVAKHRDTLQDFDDVDQGEKDYMAEWDAFVQGKLISSERYLARAFVAFAKAKAPWINDSASRAEEFAFHASMLLSKRAITPATFAEANQKLNEARVKKLEPPPEPKRHPSSDSCGKCRKPVPISEMLVCSNKFCKTRVYHDGCVRDGFLVSKDTDWLCHTCSAK